MSEAVSEPQQPTEKARESDKFAVAAAALSGVMFLIYWAVTTGQRDTPQIWVLLMLLIGSAGAAYGRFERWGRLTALWSATMVLGILGVLSILSIGLPILVAAVLCGISAVRALPSLMARR